MTERNDGGPAFGHGDPHHGGNPGMSLRDYFAAAALTGICALPEEEALSTTDAANEAYIYADAMLKERERADQ